MRTAITLGYPRGSNKAEMVYSTDVPIDEQRAALKSLPQSHPKYSRMEIWESDGGIQKSRSFDTNIEAESEKPEKVSRKKAS